MDTDKELLELAAKAAGLFEFRYVEATSWGTGITHGTGDDVYRIWNPLTDDGDALRLAVKLGIDLWIGEAIVEALTCEGSVRERYRDDEYAATRRAIVRAAAEIGKGMK